MPVYKGKEYIINFDQVFLVDKRTFSDQKTVYKNLPDIYHFTINLLALGGEEIKILFPESLSAWCFAKTGITLSPETIIKALIIINEAPLNSKFYCYEQSSVCSMMDLEKIASWGERAISECHQFTTKELIEKGFKEEELIYELDKGKRYLHRIFD